MTPRSSSRRGQVPRRSGLKKAKDGLFQQTGRPLLLLGGNGQIGWELQRTLAALGEVVVAGHRGAPLAVDLADPDRLRALLRQVDPGVIVNAAAYTAVDQAEAEPALAMAVNGTAPGILAEEAKRARAWLVQYSTDYVFDGTQGTPYTEQDEPHPLNVYGQTKLAGERAIQAVGASHLILRTSWVYGLRGRNFLLAILRRARERQPLRVVADQIGSPNWSRLIAEASAALLTIAGPDPEPYAGIYHLSATGQTSWHGFAAKIIELAVQNGRLEPGAEEMPAAISSAEYSSAARRPAYAVLSGARLERIFGLRLPSWERGLALCLEDGLAAWK
ncbi:MAG: dTDP-4-dehydrorhamnose reductase [Gammaproteobacteria bacterium]|nr:dTDP-4-dehydrorhamnose reductase [Gammaproteobacteria bacterium]